MKKILFIVILVIGVFFTNELNSSGNPEPFEQLVKKQAYSTYLKYKDVISTYVHSADLPDWAQLNPDNDGYEGTSAIAFYEYIKSRNPVSKPMAIVAIMDTGFDTDHPELKDKIWGKLALMRIYLKNDKEK